MTHTDLTTHTLRARLEETFPTFVQTLIDLIAIPSVSSLPQHSQDLDRSAQYVQQLFSDIGLEARIESVTTPEGVVGKPAVLARSPHIEGAPTVLLYAHHDVQPTGDPQRWSLEPFTAEVRGDRLYGRGSSDDGAGIVVHLGALNLLARDLPVNVIVFIEGEEELGSPTFDTFLHTYADELRADVIIVTDSDNWKVGEPALTTTLRGNCCCTLEVTVSEHAVHSGMFGGPMVDATTCASLLISSFYDEAGNVRIKGLGGSDKADVDWPEEEFRAAAGILEGVQLAGTGDLAARVWTKPSITVIGWDTTSVAEASNTIAPKTRLRLSMRTVPGIEPEKAMEALRAHIETHMPFGAHVTISDVECGPGYQADLEAPAVELAHRALTEAWSVPSVNIGVGGSIPFISQFQSEFPEAQVLVMGVEDPLTNAHSEDESQSLSDLKHAILAEALILRDLAHKP
ncbi:MULTISPECIES: dipeptidase [unclassified Schaalia]|uniref:dipeptidase n=1 Tax=unclassified Schaalia TaxID=2691889 RepID=UPI001E49050E|nr:MULTISPECIES: dipeptidase [unclassified Schaalia]MCD4549506.1 dipeptidase [Schaalia sp. lx-260]MCD4558067.1 dipeptidase [Schaalia sp. lx-100]